MALLLLIVSRSEPSRFTYLEHVFANPFSKIFLARFRREIISLIADRIAAKNTSGTFLAIGAVEAKVRNSRRERGEA